jgi:hypothetical protein
MREPGSGTAACAQKLRYGHLLAVMKTIGCGYAPVTLHIAPQSNQIRCISGLFGQDGSRVQQVVREQTLS